MSERMLNLKQAAEHVHMDVNELRHFAQRGEVEALERGSDWLFDHRALDEWAQRNLLSAGKRELKRQHSLIMDECRHHRVWSTYRARIHDRDVPWCERR